MPNAKFTADWANSLRLAPLTAAIGLALSSSPAQAGTVITVTTNASGSVAGECTLRDAVQSANNDSATAACAAGSGPDAIQFDPGVTGVITLQNSALSITESLTITGPTAGNLAVDGGDAYRILEAAPGVDVTVSNLTLQNGRSTAGGAAFQGAQSVLELDNCIVRDHVVESTGSTGAVSMQDGSVTIADTLFENNVIEGSVVYSNGGPGPGPGPGLSYGAALYLRDSAVTITGSNFNGNQSGAFGGAIALKGSNLIPEISDSGFSGNSAAYGGAIAVLDGAQLTASNVTLSGNEANSGGAAIVSGMSQATFAESTIKNNEAIEGGGLMIGFGSAPPLAGEDGPTGTSYTLGPGTLTLNDSVVSGNFASQRGGGMMAVYGSNIEGSNSTFDGNAAYVSGTPGRPNSSETGLRSRLRGAPTDAGLGGGLLLTEGAYAYLFDMGFTNNSAVQGGAVLAHANGYAVNYDGNFNGNSAQFGGAMQAGLITSPVRTDRNASERGSIAITVCGNCTVTDNTAGFGGALAAFDGGIAFLAQSQVTGNQAQSGAVGVAYYGTAALKYSTVSNNSATGYGGALYSFGSGSTVVSLGSSLSQNQAANGAGIANLGGGSVNVYDSLIAGNEATAAGGAIFSDSGTTGQTRLENSTIAGNSAPNYGGIVASGLNANFVTVAGNQSTGSRATTASGPSNNAGGVYIDVSGDVEIRNTIIANNTSTGTALDLVIPGASMPLGSGSGSVTMDYTLVEAPGTGTPTGAGNLLGIDPQLLALADNGGPTQTLALAAASPAVDAGNPAPTDAPDFDQRGEPFPRIAGGRADMGAFELIIDPLFSDRFEP